MKTPAPFRGRNPRNERCLAGSVLNRAIGLSICSAAMMIVLGVAAVALPGATGIGVAILVASIVIFGGWTGVT